MRRALLITVLLAVMGASAAAARVFAPGGSVGVFGVCGNGAGHAAGGHCHVGDTLQYSTLVYDTTTKKVIPAQSVSMALLAAGRVLSLQTRPYKPSFWVGNVKLPTWVSGRARVRANVHAAGASFTLYSGWFTVGAPVKAVEVGKASSQGDFAVAIATGTIDRPADGYVLASVQTSPSQAVDMNWTAVCARGTSASSKNGSATDGGPGTVSGNMVIEKVKMSLPNADSCTVSFSAQLHGSGTLKIEILGNSFTG